MRAEEWLVDVAAADPAALSSADRVRALCDALVARSGLTPVAPALVHVFPPPGGVTALVLLSESHLAVHTWPEHGGALLSLGTCNVGAAASLAWRELVAGHLGVDAVVQVRRVARAIGAQPARRSA
jgi:S-adenosylmethionine decarboxylase